jgi:hypothetical protein
MMAIFSGVGFLFSPRVIPFLWYRVVKYFSTSIVLPALVVFLTYGIFAHPFF